MLTIRPARIEDAQILHEWRNDPLTRAMSTNDNEVSWEDHIRWFSGRLRASDCRFFIAVLDDVPVGTIRFEGNDESIGSWTVAPGLRGRGICQEMLRLGLAGEGQVTAKVRANNEICRRVVTALGFELLSDGPLQVWRRRNQWRRAPSHLAETSMYVPM